MKELGGDMDVENGFCERFERAKFVHPGLEETVIDPSYFEIAFDTSMTYWLAPLSGIICGIFWVNW